MSRNPASPPDKPLALGELATHLNVSKSTVRRMIRRGMPHSRTGGKRGSYRFNLMRVRKWMRLD